MTILQGTTSTGQIIPVQVDNQGRLVAQGLDGPQGPAGPTGPQGPLGPQGPIGAPGGTPAGSILWFAMATPPTGYLKCNGQAVSRTTYLNLFQAIGTTFGAGDGSTTFLVPDLRGEFIRSWDDGRGADPGRALGSSQADAFKSHSHTFTATDRIGTNGAQGGLNVAGSYTTAPAGGSETRPRNIALLACISF